MTKYLIAALVVWMAYQGARVALGIGDGPQQLGRGQQLEEALR